MRLAFVCVLVLAALAAGVAARSAPAPRLSFGGAQGLEFDGGFAGSGDAETLAAGDVSGDRKADLVLGSFADRVVWLAIRRPQGGFMVSDLVQFVAGVPAALAVADLNGDGLGDVVVANGTGAKVVSVLLNDGTGGFHRADYATGPSPQGVAVADLDGDGRPDVVTANSSARTVSVLRNLGGGTFAPRADYPTGPLPTAVAAGALNGDGRADLVTANGGAATVSVLLNRGNGSFRGRADVVTGGAPNSLALADFDGDGRLDLATANPRAPRGRGVSVLLGRGDGTFRPRRDYAVGAHASRVVAGDVNGDGRADLAFSDTGNLAVLLDRGDGTFEPPLWFGYAEAVAPADFNLDGRLDLAGAWVNDRNGDWNVSAHLNTPGLCDVQNVLGKTLAAARQLLQRADCAVGAVRRGYSRRVARGRVLRQSPRFPGSVLRQGGKVALVLSRGRR
ncbi:MAG TPA: FG-GAP-like repeat-containing protein [Gaiellaceae bacterium]|nr:FG-GAP-like repeat-containing protein [Gaiellaceae bacterium]